MTVFDSLQELPEPIAVVTCANRIEQLCPMSELDETLSRQLREMGGGGVMTPGLVDCHTHPVIGGNRADEFARRLEDASYTGCTSALPMARLHMIPGPQSWPTPAHTAPIKNA